MEQSTDQSEKPTRWLQRWLKSDEFWQGIAIQTIGTLAAALILALVAIFTGVGYTAAIRFYVMASILFILGLFGTGALSDFAIRRLRPKPKLIPIDPDIQWLVRVAVLILAIAAIWGGFGLLLSYLTPAIARWTGYTIT